MLTISIALCTYNGARFLEAQLSSLAQQSVKPNELVVCDDGSIDETIEILEAFAAHAPFKVRIFRNPENLGYVKNFEKTISACQCDLIFMCDQDDVWHPQKLERCLAVFDENPSVGMVLHDFTWIDHDGAVCTGHVEAYGDERVGAAGLPKLFRQSSIEVFMRPYPRAWCGCMMAFRGEFVGLIVPIFPGKGHDDWILKLLGPITHVWFLTDKLVDYRIHGQNANGRDVTKRTFRYRWERFRYKANRVLRGYSKRGFYNQILERLRRADRPITYPRLIGMYREAARWFR